MSMTTSIQTAAVVSGAFLSGAMMSLSFVAVPAALDTTSRAAPLLQSWTRIDHYAHRIMPVLVISTLLLYIYATTRNRSAKRPWGLCLLAGAATVGTIPFTLILMESTNDELFRLQQEASVADPLALEYAEAKQLVVRWTWMHFTRSLFPLAGAILGTQSFVH